MATTIPKEVFLQYKRKTKRKMLLLLAPILFALFFIACFGGYQFHQLNKRVKKLEKMIQNQGGLREDVYAQSLELINSEVNDLAMSVKILQKQYNELDKQSQHVLLDFNKRLQNLKERTEGKHQWVSEVTDSIQEIRKEVRDILQYRNSSDLDHDRNVTKVFQAVEDKISRVNETLGASLMDKFEDLKREQEEKHKVYQRDLDNNISLLLDMIDNLNRTGLNKVEEHENRNITSWELEEDVRMLKEGRDSYVRVENFHATEAYLEGKIEELKNHMKEIAVLFKAKAIKSKSNYDKSPSAVVDAVGTVFDFLFSA